MRVVVAGGTGLVGQRLKRVLHDRGDEVIILSRSGEHTWDPSAPTLGPWAQQIDGAGAVVNLAGSNLADGRWTPEFLRIARSSRVDSTRALGRAIARASVKPKVLVNASAIGIYGLRMDDEKMDERAPPGTDVIARLCVDWEDAANGAREHTRVVHPRIGIVLDKDGGALKKMLTPFRAFVGGPLGSGTQSMSFIHWRDTVRALVWLIDNAIEGPVNVTAPQSVTMNEFAKALGKALARPSCFRVPAFALRLAVGDFADVVLTGQNAPPEVLLASGFTFDFPTLPEALADCLGSASR